MSVSHIGYHSCTSEAFIETHLVLSPMLNIGKRLKDHEMTSRSFSLVGGERNTHKGGKSEALEPACMEQKVVHRKFRTGGTSLK